MIVEVTVLTLTSKEWDPNTWNGDNCLVPDETGNPELSSLSEPPLLRSYPLLPETSLFLRENPVINSYGPDAL